MTIWNNGEKKEGGIFNYLFFLKNLLINWLYEQMTWWFLGLCFILWIWNVLVFHLICLLFLFGSRGIDAIYFFRSLLKNFVKVNFLRTNTRVWMTQVLHFMELRILLQFNIPRPQLHILWGQDGLRHGLLDLVILMMGIRGKT